MKEIKEGQCVMCRDTGEYVVEETGELLCGYCWNENEILLAKNRGDRIIKF